MPENQYFLIFGSPDVFITCFSNRGYLQSVKIKEGINNSKRPHQGIDQRVPMGYKPQLHGGVQCDGFSLSSPSAQVLLTTF